MHGLTNGKWKNKEAFIYIIGVILFVIIEKKYESSDFKGDVNFVFAIPLDIPIVIKFIYQGG